MNLLKKIGKNKVWQIAVLLLLFHAFWILFYYISGSYFLKSLNVDYFIKVSIINTLGFVVFCLAAYGYFPSFISRKKYFWFTILSLVTIIITGYLQYKLQDWNPDFFFRRRIATQTQMNIGLIIPAPIQQPIGAPVRAMFTMMVYLLLGVGYAYMKDWFIKDRYTRVLEKEKLQAELSLLRYQLNPHFLFNIINNIYYLAIIKSEKTPEAILKVSELLRYVLNDKEDKVSLEKELNYLHEFIKLQQFRFPDQQVSVSIDIKEELSNYLIAPLLLITFAENAFKHGEPGTEEDPVVIHLKFENNQLEYAVSNKINKNDKKDNTTGIGLRNLKRRLQLLYPHKHQLQINNNNGHFDAQLKIDLS